MTEQHDVRSLPQERVYLEGFPGPLSLLAACRREGSSWGDYLLVGTGDGRLIGVSSLLATQYLHNLPPATAEMLWDGAGERVVRVPFDAPPSITLARPVGMTPEFVEEEVWGNTYRLRGGVGGGRLIRVGWAPESRRWVVWG